MRRALAVLVVLSAVLWITGGRDVNVTHSRARGVSRDLSKYSPTPPERRLRLLFIHHSVGGQWLASPASEPNGGGLRAALEAQGYEVREASYGSRVGERTDLFDWLPKFQRDMDDVLTTLEQDRRTPAGAANEIVMFKSCFPNSRFVGRGEPPGAPDGPALTVWNARAALRMLRGVLARRPDVLFVYVTAPPLPSPAAQPAWRRAAVRVRSWVSGTAEPEESARLAREFNDWVKAPDGWLAGYLEANVAVFDYYDVLTDHGRSNFLAYATDGGRDAHPAASGHQRATAEFIPFLNRSVRRAGIVP